MPALHPTEIKNIRQASVREEVLRVVVKQVSLEGTVIGRNRVASVDEAIRELCCSLTSVFEVAIP
jgi:hypothetical protein